MLSRCSGDNPAVNSTNSSMCTGRSLPGLELQGNCSECLGESTWMEDLCFRADTFLGQENAGGAGLVSPRGLHPVSV